MGSLQRPYPLRTAGIPLSLRYDPDTTIMKFEFANPTTPGVDKSFDSTKGPPLTGHPAITSNHTEIFLPPRFVRAWQGPTITRPFGIDVSDGSWKVDPDRQVLIWTHTDLEAGAKHSIQMRIKRLDDAGPGMKETIIYILLALLAVIAAYLMNARS